jgi:hypothetical protein
VVRSTNEGVSESRGFPELEETTELLADTEEEVDAGASEAGTLLD